MGGPAIVNGIEIEEFDNYYLCNFELDGNLHLLNKHFSIINHLTKTIKKKF